ncbi:LysR family transcriptional regulator [Nocardioides humi]|uniref:LysR family transcriptional regulator n=1 Tax=Nocardioides humi TaxID=449461 RepID=A0ABN2AMX7_9ACTN|nr:LysR family transcriptional regulator [Nocardioides humi]
MTPTRLRAYAAVARLGSVKAAAAELGVSEAAVSLHVGQLRKELGDQLFVRTGSGIAFTPGGLRLASRAVQLLGLQDRTVQEVQQAGGARRLLRVGVSGLFAEYAAPGLIEAFTQRADDLEVELRTDRASRFGSLLVTRTIDAAVGPRVQLAAPELSTSHFLNYEVVAVAAPGHPAASGQPALAMLREQSWLLGPSASERGGIVTEMLARLAVPEQRQRIFQSHAAALEEAKRGRGIALTVDFAVSADADDSLVVVPGPLLRGRGEWSLATLGGERASTAADELRRFVVTPRATQAMLRRRGAGVGRFRPAVHVTLWS